MNEEYLLSKGMYYTGGDPLANMDVFSATKRFSSTLILLVGPIRLIGYGYFLNTSMMQLIFKPEYFAEARKYLVIVTFQIPLVVSDT